MSPELVHPWPRQAAQPGYVHVERPYNPESYVKLARRWARRNRRRVEVRIFGDVVLLRWSRDA